MYNSETISFYIISLGCSKNLVDAEKLNGALLSAGFISAEASDEADILIINTCGFIVPAKEESINLIFEALELQESRLESENLKSYSKGDSHIGVDFKKRVIVVGCLSQRYGEELQKEIPELDLIYGVLDADFIPELCSRFEITLEKNPIPVQRSFIELPYSYIKIAEGCSNKCSYCAIPQIRGEHHSYPISQVLTDAETAVKGGAKELIIIAQDITQYQADGHGLVDLLEQISHLTSLEWIRLMYCHPDHISNSLIECMKRDNKILRYLDIPFQHVSERLIHSMGRKGNYDMYLDLIQRLRQDIPGIAIRSTFMVGYPGESEEDFSLLLTFLKEAVLDRVGAFTFSPEESTVAMTLQNQVPEEVKEERYHELMTLQREISLQRMEERIGQPVKVIIEEKVDAHTYLGRSEFDAPEVDGVFYLTAENVVINTIVESRVTDAVEYDLIGELA